MEIITKELDNFSAIRIITVNNREWFLAKDVAELLGYVKTRNAVSQHCKKAVAIGYFFKEDQDPPPLNFQDIFGNNWKNIKLIPESDVLLLISKSKTKTVYEKEEILKSLDFNKLVLESRKEIEFAKKLKRFSKTF
jgi:prophage antirepressor-like protein